MADNLNLQVVIRTEADVAAVEKTTSEIGKMGKTTDELDASLARLKSTIAQAEAGLKEIGDTGAQTGTKLSEGMKNGAGSAISSLEGIIPATNINDIITGAWRLGSEIGSKLGEAMQLATRDKLDWDHLFGDGDELDATALKRKHALEEVRQAYADLLKQLEKPPEDVIVAYLARLTEQAHEAAVQLGELKKLQGVADKAEDRKDTADFADKKAAIENSGMSEPEKIRARAELENEKADLELAKRSERRVQEIANAATEADVKGQAAKDAGGARTEAEIRQAAAGQIVGSEEYMRAKASGADERYLKKKFDRAAREMGYDDLGEEDLPGKNGTDSANVRKATAAHEKALRDARDAVTREAGLIERTSIENESDAAATMRGNLNRSAEAGGKADKAEQDGLSKDAADAAKDAKKATSEGDKSTKEMASLLKQLAAMIGGKNTAMTAALQDMARSLADGASGAELARIKQATDVISKTQNEQARSMSGMVESLVGAVQSAAAHAKEAMGKARSLETQIQNMR